MGVSTFHKAYIKMAVEIVLANKGLYKSTLSELEKISPDLIILDEERNENSIGKSLRTFLQEKLGNDVAEDILEEATDMIITAPSLKLSFYLRRRDFQDTLYGVLRRRQLQNLNEVKTKDIINDFGIYLDRYCYNKYEFNSPNPRKYIMNAFTEIYLKIGAQGNTRLYEILNQKGTSMSIGEEGVSTVDLLEEEIESRDLDKLFYSHVKNIYIASRCLYYTITKAGDRKPDCLTNDDGTFETDLFTEFLKLKRREKINSMKSKFKNSIAGSLFGFNGREGLTSDSATVTVRSELFGMFFRENLDLDHPSIEEYIDLFYKVRQNLRSEKNSHNVRQPFKKESGLTDSDKLREDKEAFRIIYNGMRSVDTLYKSGIPINLLEKKYPVKGLISRAITPSGERFEVRRNIFQYPEIATKFHTVGDFLEYHGHSDKPKGTAKDKYLEKIASETFQKLDKIEAKKLKGPKQNIVNLAVLSSALSHSLLGDQGISFSNRKVLAVSSLIEKYNKPSVQNNYNVIGLYTIYYSLMNSASIYKNTVGINSYINVLGRQESFKLADGTNFALTPVNLIKYYKSMIKTVMDNAIEVTEKSNLQLRTVACDFMQKIKDMILNLIEELCENDLETNDGKNILSYTLTLLNVVINYLEGLINVCGMLYDVTGISLLQNTYKYKTKIKIKKTIKKSSDLRMSLGKSSLLPFCTIEGSSVLDPRVIDVVIDRTYRELYSIMYQLVGSLNKELDELYKEVSFVGSIENKIKITKQLQSLAFRVSEMREIRTKSFINFERDLKHRAGFKYSQEGYVLRDNRLYVYDGFYVHRNGYLVAPNREPIPFE